MLKYIKKRDGSIESFDPEKINRWSSWASEEVKSRVDWGSVVLKAVRDCAETMESQALQELLIKHCTRKKSWPYALMAGKLYNSVIRKQLFDGVMPTVLDQHMKMIEIGLMRPLMYSEQEYGLVEDIIDHDRDMHMPYHAIKQLHRKYGLANVKTDVRYETPQLVYIRMAMALSEDEESHERLTHVKKWYDMFSKAIINCPTPYYVNLGTSHNGYSSCCLYSADDNARSLAVGDHIAYTMTYMSAGIGGIVHSRSYGDPVRGGRIKHQGKLPYYESKSAAVHANLQGGRGGAATTYFSIYDPEAETILRLQNPLTPVDIQNRGIHFAFLFNRFFVRKVLRNEEIFTFNAYTAPDLYQSLFSKDEEEFEGLYNKYEQDVSFEKKYVDARKLAVVAWTQRQEVATLYDGNINEINRHTPFQEPIYSSNLCVAGDTLILIWDKEQNKPIEVPIIECVDKKVSVWNGENWSEVQVVLTARNQSLWRITTSMGHSIQCTPYHKFFIYNDSNDALKVEAQWLKCGDKVMSWVDPESGLMVGEMTEIADIEQNVSVQDTYCFTELERGMGVFAGILTGNCLEITQPTASYQSMVDIYTKDDVGYVIFETAEGGQVKMPWSEEVKIWMDGHSKISYLGAVKQGDVIDVPSTQSIVFSKVLKIHESKKEPEVSLCSLGGIVIYNAKNDETYEDAAYYTLKMIDKCIHMSDYELPHVGYTAKKRMNAGVGMLGLAYDLAMKDLKFNTFEGMTEIHRIAERHSYYLIKASLRLAKEKGKAQWMHKTNWPNGWLPIDTYRKAVDELADPKLHYDWESLRAEIISNGGIRNSSLVAHMPTESSSKASATPNGVYPIRDLSLKKTDSDNTLDWVAPDNDLLEDKYQLAWDLSMTDQLKFYAVLQKFADQAISCDTYRNRMLNPEISDEELIDEMRVMTKYGVKTQYYQNSYTESSGTKDGQLSAVTNTADHIPGTPIIGKSEGPNCVGGACTL